MQLLTQGSARALPILYSQEQVKDPVVHVKFFLPWGSWTWYATEAASVIGTPDGAEENVSLTDPRAGDYVLFFGLVDGFEEELGYFSLDELQSVRGPGGLRIERDLHWAPRPLSQCYRAARRV